MSVREPQPPQDANVIAGNLFIKHMRFVHAGDRNHGHCHTYDHLTLITAGSLEAHYEGRVEILRAPHIFLTEKARAHQFVALEDGTTVCCIHVLKDLSNGDRVISEDTPLEEARRFMDYVCMRIDEQTTIV